MHLVVFDLKKKFSLNYIECDEWSSHYNANILILNNFNKKKTEKLSADDYSKAMDFVSQYRLVSKIKTKNSFF